MKRLIAMLAASIVIVLLVAQMGLSRGTRTDGLYYKAAGIHPDAQLVQIDGQTITAEEYLYWLAYVCEYLNTTMNGQLDLNAPLNEETTFGEYAKLDAANTVTLYAVTRAWAEENGIALTEEDEAALETQRQQYISYYGSEEACLQQLELVGISAEMLDHIEETPYLYAQLHDAFVTEGGVLHPDAESLAQFGLEQDYVTARLLFFATTGMDEQGIADVRAKAESFAAELQQAEDRDATYESLAEQLDLDTNPAGLTFSPAKSDPSVCSAVAALEEGQVSDVIEGANGFYVALRMPLDHTALLEDMFIAQLQDRQANAKVKYHQRLYDSIDAAEFYRSLTEERLSLLQNATAQIPNLDSPSDN